MFVDITKGNYQQMEIISPPIAGGSGVVEMSINKIYNCSCLRFRGMPIKKHFITQAAIARRRDVESRLWWRLDDDYEAALLIMR